MRRFIPHATVTVLAGTLALSAATAPKAGRDWPQFRGIAANGITEGFCLPTECSCVFGGRGCATFGRRGELNLRLRQHRVGVPTIRVAT